VSRSTDLHRLWVVGLRLAWARDGASAVERRTEWAKNVIFNFYYYFSVCCTLCK